MAVARRPCTGLSGAWWSRFLLALLALFHLFCVVGTVSARGLFDYMGSDFLSFRSASEIVWQHGFAQVYDLDLQGQYQLHVCQAYAAEPARCATAPTFYLPAFVLLFLPLALLPPVPGFVLWTALNLAALGLYLWRFGRAVGLRDGGTFLVLAVLSAPVFANWFFGQVSLLMLVCLGEVLLAGQRGREYRAGLWLAGLLLKPQILLLILPGLLVGRRFKVLAGFALAGVLVLGLSLLLVGPDGLLRFGQLLLAAAGVTTTAGPTVSAAVATTHPEVMMNWRALATNLAALLPAPLAWGPAIAGMALTALAGLSLWLRPAAVPSLRFDTAMLGTYAASAAVTWHAHTNLAAPLIVLLLLLHVRGTLSRAALQTWFFVPALLFAVAFFTLPAIAYNLTGLSLLALNVCLVGWATWALWRRQPDPATTASSPALDLPAGPGSAV